MRARNRPSGWHSKVVSFYAARVKGRRKQAACLRVLFLPWLALVVALSGGCAHYDSKPLKPETTAASFERRSIEDPGLKPFLEVNLGRPVEPWPPASWDFDMLTLAAYYYQPRLDVARAQWRVAEAGIKTAGGRLNPTVNFGPGYNVNAMSGVTPWLPFVNFDIPIETAGKRGKRIATAEQLSTSARLQIAEAAWQVRSGLLKAVLEFGAASKRADLLKAQTASQEQVARALEQRLAAGAASAPEVSLVRIALQKSRVDLGEALRLQAESRARVAEAVGVQLAGLGKAKFEFNPRGRQSAVQDLSSSEAKRQAVLSRPDILSGLADYAASQAALQLEIAKQYPNLHISPGYNLDNGENKWQLGFGLELPVLNRNEGPIAEAEARRTESAARFNALQAKVLAETERAVESVRATEKNLASTDTLYEEQLRQRNAIEAQTKAGEIDPLESLTSELELVAAQLARLDIETKYQQSIGALEDAMHRPIFGLIGTVQGLETGVTTRAAKSE